MDSLAAWYCLFSAVKAFNRIFSSITLHFCNISKISLPHMEGVAEKPISPVEGYEKSTAIFQRWTKGWKQREKRIFNVTPKLYSYAFWKRYVFRQAGVVVCYAQDQLLEGDVDFLQHPEHWLTWKDQYQMVGWWSFDNCFYINTFLKQGREILSCLPRSA